MIGWSRRAFYCTNKLTCSHLVTTVRFPQMPWVGRLRCAPAGSQQRDLRIQWTFYSIYFLFFWLPAALQWCPCLFDAIKKFTFRLSTLAPCRPAPGGPVSLRMELTMPLSTFIPKNHSYSLPFYFPMRYRCFLVGWKKFVLAALHGSIAPNAPFSHGSLECIILALSDIFVDKTKEAAQ